MIDVGGFVLGIIRCSVGRWGESNIPVRLLLAVVELYDVFSWFNASGVLMMVQLPFS